MANVPARRLGVTVLSALLLALALLALAVAPAHAAGPPAIVEQIPLDAQQHTVTLRAQVDPNGQLTTYHFEWGAAGGPYDRRIPASGERSAGAGSGPVTVSALLGGLEEASAYRFRVVAANAAGTAVGPDQPFQTLNQSGLPDGRAFELVSPADKGPSGSVSEFSIVSQTPTAGQASQDGESFVYPIQNGIPESSAGGWTRWRAERSG